MPGINLHTMNFKLLFHVLGKAIKMLMALLSYLPQTLLGIRIYLHGLEWGKNCRDVGCPFSSNPTTSKPGGP